MDKRIKVDQEIIGLVKEYIAILIKDTGIKYSQGDAVRIALKKVLLK